MRNVNSGVRPWRATRGLVSRLALALVLSGVCATAAPAAAANREHQQLMADIRMLQEQTQQLQQSIGQLTDVLKLVTTRLDEQNNLNRKAFADQRLLIDTLTGEVRIVREKLDDTNVRLSSLSQEVDALRQQPAPQPVPVAPPTSGDPSATGLPPGAIPAPGSDPGAVQPGAGVPGATTGTAPAAGPAPASVGMSPTRLYEIAQADYAGGQWALAINGFETYLRTFPKTEKADDAQFFIGEAYQLDGKFKDAIAAYDRVITDYPSGDRVPDAYYKRGLAFSRLAQNDRARESFEAVIKNYPNSEAARLAKQLLDRLGRGSREQ